jgi:hypothetical protein
VVDPTGRHALGIGMHHLICDGVAVARVHRDFWDAYQDPASIGEPAELQYGDYAAWQERALTDGKLEEELAYWRPRLAGAKPPRLTTGIPDDDAALHDAGIVEFEVLSSVASALRETASALDVTELCLLFSTFAALAGIAAGQDDVTIATHVPSRMVAGTRARRIPGALHTPGFRHRSDSTLGRVSAAPRSGEVASRHLRLPDAHPRRLPRQRPV